MSHTKHRWGIFCPVRNNGQPALDMMCHPVEKGEAHFVTVDCTEEQYDMASKGIEVIFNDEQMEKLK